MSGSLPRSRFTIIIVLLIALIGIGTVSAQTVQPIAIDQNVFATLADANTALIYSLTIDAPTNVVIQTLSVTNTLALRFNVVAPSGVIVGEAPNIEAASIATARLSLPVAGAYFIRVSSANGTTGDFLLTVQAAAGGAGAVAAQPLTPGAPINADVNSGTVQRVYSFSGSAAETVLVDVRSAAASPIVTLKDSTTGDVLAMSGTRLGGVTFRIPPGSTITYHLEIASAGAPATYIVCVGTDGGSAPCPFTPASGGSVSAPVVVTVTPVAAVVIAPDAACQVTPLNNNPVNVRRGPGLTFPIVASLNVGATAQVFGRLADSTWFQINSGGVLGWVAASVIRLGGACLNVGIVVPPPSPTPTLTPLGPTLTWTPTLAATATATPTLPPATLTPTTAPATLNFSLPPVFGSSSLTSGFVPDPATFGMTAAGPVDVSYLGGGCRGFTTSAPTFSLTYTSGAFPLLRFYFVGSGDSVMVINSPNGSYFCNDDSFGTLNPTIDFNSPSSGRYDIWIGTLAQGNAIGGTLNVTENSGNRP